MAMTDSSGTRGAARAGERPLDRRAQARSPLPGDCSDPDADEKTLREALHEARHAAAEADRL